MDELNKVLRPAGIMLMGIAFSLGLVDWHYQSAFEAIRNVMARMEASIDFKGPWREHFEARKIWKDFIASYLPFGLLFAMGAVATFAQIPASGTSNLDNINRNVWIILIPEIIFFIYGIVRAYEKHNKENDKIIKCLQECKNKQPSSQGSEAKNQDIIADKPQEDASGLSKDEE